METKKSVLTGVAAGAFLCLAGLAGAQETEGGAGIKTKPMSAALGAVSQAMLDGATKDDKNWLMSNGGYDQARFYPAKQINTTNRSWLTTSPRRSRRATASRPIRHG